MTKHQHEMISKDHANGVTSPNGDCEEIERSLRPLIEIGWIMVGALDELDREAIEEAQQDAKDWLCRTFSEFEWKMPMVWRDEANHALRVEPVQLLDYGVTECNLRHWDFTLIVTSADLVSHYKSNALSVVSRSLQAGVISTARIGPYADQYENTAKGRILLLASRLRALTIHLIGHLAGLEHEDDPESFMAGFETVECLDSAKYLGPGQTEQLRAGLQEVADQRLEEKADVQQAWTLRFYLQAAWINRRQIAEAVVQANPWQFPFRLSRLTTGAASAMLILMVTAEAWELGLSQSGLVLAALAGAAIMLTTLYVIARQQLYVRREDSRLSESRVVANVSTFAIVLTGMITTFATLVLTTFLFGELLFGLTLIKKWVPVANPANAFWIYGKIAVFVASIGMFIAALGATFESNRYFRHITFVDEEI